MVLEDRDGFLRYVEGAYVVRINTPRIVLWGVSNSSQDFTDIRIEVAAHDKSEIFEVSFGVLCNYQDAENFYLFEIGPDGFYRIVRVSAGEQVVLAGEELSVDIAIGQETYQMEVECALGRQSLHVDGKEIAQVMDTTHTTGDVGLLAHSYARGGVEIYFDDLKVSSLE